MSTENTQALASVPAVRVRTSRFDLRRDALRIAIVLLAILLLDALVWAWLVRPVRRDLAELEERKASAVQIENRERAQLAEIEAVQKHVEATEKGIDTFYNEMLKTKRERLVPFQLELVKLGRQFNVAPQNLTIGSEELESEGIDSMAFSFPLTGGYENLRQFLEKLEREDQFLIVREISLSGGREGGRALQLNVTVETYFNAPELREEAARKAEAKRALQSSRRGK